MLTLAIQQDLEMIYCAVLAGILGGLIGWEREKHRPLLSAGIRTYGAIALGACVFGSLSYFSPMHDTRIAAQVVTGIGFLGAGMIFRQGDYTAGLTTAATLWATSAIGLAIAFRFYIVGIFLTLLIYLLLYLPRLPWWQKFSSKNAAHH